MVKVRVIGIAKKYEKF